ncbi:hypothetical protein cand_001520 [Cryptosporidium andersoni]|uniref:EF-hand domain-containing protein n=1 Tax=Cryptosporidium andersoni TaxID=117008 RepID=A0A1J4MUC0_9CRYT|nr:hypothetical protein cand_001520 [Cryptosporidium andersoni]
MKLRKSAQWGGTILLVTLLLNNISYILSFEPYFNKSILTGKLEFQDNELNFVDSDNLVNNKILSEFINNKNSDIVDNNDFKDTIHSNRDNINNNVIIPEKETMRVKSKREDGNKSKSRKVHKYGELNKLKKSRKYKNLNKMKENNETVNNTEISDESKHNEESTEVYSIDKSVITTYFLLSGLLIIVSIITTLIIRDCIVNRIRNKKDSFLQEVMDTVFRQVTCIFVALALSYCFLTTRIVDIVRNILLRLQNLNTYGIIDNMKEDITNALNHESISWTAANLSARFNDVMIINIVMFVWYCIFVLYFTICVKILEKWIRYADDTDLGSLIKALDNINNIFKRSREMKVDEGDYSRSSNGICNNIPVTILGNSKASIDIKSSVTSVSHKDEKSQNLDNSTVDETRLPLLRYNTSMTESDSSTDFENSNINDIGYDVGVLNQFEETIDLDIDKSSIGRKKKSGLISSGKSKSKKILIMKSQDSLVKKIYYKAVGIWKNFWIWQNKLFLTYSKAHFIALRYDFMDEVATYNYGSFSSTVSGDTVSSFDDPNSSWLVSLTDPTTSLVAGVYFTEYLRAKLLIQAITLIRIPISTLSFLLLIGTIIWSIFTNNYEENGKTDGVSIFSSSSLFSEPMICFQISMTLFAFSLIIWLRSLIIKHQLQPKNLLGYLKLKYSLDVGIPQQEIEYEEVMPRYKNNKIDMCVGEHSSLFCRLKRYLNFILCGTVAPSLHDNLFLFKRNGPDLLLRWFQASYFLQLLLISIVAHLSYIQKDLWYNQHRYITFSIWIIFGLQHFCLVFITYPLLLCTSVGQMADKAVLDEVLNIQKSQNIERLLQVAEALRFASFMYSFTKGNDECREIQRRHYSLLSKTAPWDLQIKCRNTMNYLISNVPIKTKDINNWAIDIYTIKYFLISEGLYYCAEHAEEILTIFDYDKDNYLDDAEFSVCYYAIQHYFMGDLDVSILLDYLEVNYGINPTSSTGIDLQTFTSLVKNLGLRWSNGQIRHAMIFLSGERSLSALYLASINRQSPKKETRNKRRFVLSVKVNDFINKLITIGSGIPSNIANNYYRTTTRGSIQSFIHPIETSTSQNKNTHIYEEAEIEKYIYSDSNIEEEVTEKV